MCWIAINSMALVFMEGWRVRGKYLEVQRGKQKRERERGTETDRQTDSIISDLSYVTDPSYV